MQWGGLLNKIIEGTVQVQAARYGQRLAGTGEYQTQSLQAVDRPNNAQAVADSYPAAENGGGGQTWMLIGLAVVAGAVFLALKK